MFFHSLSYLLFLPGVLVLFEKLRAPARPLLLLAASIVFYGFLRAPHLLVILALVTAITYVLGIRIESSATDRQRKLLLWLGVVANVGMLLGLRHLRHVEDLLARLGSRVSWSQPLVAIGTSYVALQAISYLADVYIGSEKAERRPARLALFLAFFPKLIQGPIERCGPFLRQVDDLGPLEASHLSLGMIRFAWGLFRKVVVADRLSGYVDYVYGDPAGHSGLVVVVATYLYGLQLYFDFAGYTDMALGSAQMLGIRLTENFDRPYLATSVADFWRRWHISLSRWLLDYVFTPLQLAWRGWHAMATPLALLVTFAVSGLWHGSSATFLAWGVLHGLYLSVGVLSQRRRNDIHRALGFANTRLLRGWQTFATFHLVSFAWIFFRSRSIRDALQLVRSIGLDPHGIGGLLLAQGQREALVTVLLLAGLGVAALTRALGPDRRVAGPHAILRLAATPPLRLAQYFALVLAILALGRFTQQSFIYANF